MKERKGKKDFFEFVVLAAFTLPGLGLALGGLKLCEGANRFTPAGAALVTVGGALMVTAGYYHYRKDYAPAHGGRGFLVFATVTAVSVIAAVLVAVALTRLFR